MINLIALSLCMCLHMFVSLKDDFGCYIESLTGSVPVVTAIEASKLSNLPLYLRSYYGYANTSLFGRQLLLALQSPDTVQATPSEYARHYGALHNILGTDVVLIVPKIDSSGRQQLIRMGVPFVVPQRQVYLPPMMVDLREHFPRQVSRTSGRLTAAAQVVLLRHLLGKSAEQMSLRELAGELGYSAMTMSTVRYELESMALCKTVQEGRRTHLVFTQPMRTLWERAEPHLQNPVRSRHWVRWNHGGKIAIQAGLTALAAVSLVSDDEIPSFALKSSDYRSWVEEKFLVTCPGPDGAEACMECWIYDPRLLSDGASVDILSLFLSLRDNDDERVVKALKACLEELRW